LLIIAKSRFLEKILDKEILTELSHNSPGSIYSHGPN